MNQNYKKIKIILIFIAVFLIIFYLAKDWLELGADSNFSWKQILLFLIGLGILIILSKDIIFLFKKRTKKFFLIFFLLIFIIFSFQFYIFFNFNNRNRQVKREFFKEIILSDYPQIEDENISDCHRVSLIRKWAGEQIKGSSDELSFSSQGSNYYYLDAADIYLLFQENKGGTACVGSSYFLMKLYELFGYKSFRIGIGGPWPDGLWPSHALTSVEIEQDEEKILSIQDAYFNNSYIDENGKCLDYFNMLKLLEKQNHKKIVILNQEKGIWRDYLYLENDETIVDQKFYSLDDFNQNFSKFFKMYELPKDYSYQHLSNLTIRDLSLWQRIIFLSKIPIELSFFEKIKFLLKIPYVKLKYSDFNFLKQII